MRLPNRVLCLLPLWGYICPKCKKEVKQKSHKCPYCGENYGIPLRVPPKALKDKQALEDYVHKYVFPRISANQRDYLTQFFTILFSDGFETGDLTAWAGQSTSNGTVTVTTSEHHHGDYAQDSYISTGTWSRADNYKSLGTQTDVYGRCYVKLGALPSSGNYGLLSYIGRYGDSSQLAHVKIYNNGGQIQLGYHRYYPSGADVLSNVSMSAGQWYCIELHCKKDSVNGEIQVWLDGVSVAHETGVNTSSGYCDYFGVGIRTEGWSASGYHFYFDCVVVADAYVGVEGEAVLKEVADSLSLGDALLCNKTFAVADSVGLVDVPLKDWNPQISDSIASLDAILTDKTFSVFDSISLCELITVVTEIIKQVADSVSLSDGVSLDKALLLADQIGLTDNVYVNKILTVSDGVALVEVVEKSVQGVVKTKVFLMIGDLAVQLTGD